MSTRNAGLAWLHVKTDSFAETGGNAALTFQSTGVGLGIAGVPQARDSALIEAGLDLLVTPQATLGVSYLGQIASGVEDHAVKGQFTWRF